MAELEKIVLESCIVDFDDIQGSLRLYSLSLNASKVMMLFFKFWPENIKKTIITLDVLRLKLNSLNETFTSSKSIVQLVKTKFSDAVISIEKKTVENQL